VAEELISIATNNATGGPADMLAEEAIGQGVPSECKEEGQKERKLIAIVEDDNSIAKVLHEALEDEGQWRVHIFKDGQEAKNALPTLGADLILLDVGLPGLDGASLYRMLRGHSMTRHIPIVVITGSHDWELYRMGLQTGLLLRKPFKIQKLLGIVRAVLAESQGPK
jgi:DNA-binding response OmpR family regulator